MTGPTVLYYSFTGTTKKICGCLAESLGAASIEIREIRRRNVVSAYTLGALAAIRRKTSAIQPIEDDISASECLVVASPVWAGHVTPAVSEFLRKYELRGKTIYGLVVAAASFGAAAAELKQEIEAAGAVCPNVMELTGGKGTIHDLKSGRKLFAVEDGKLVRKDGAPE